jgi:WD40 repeat protein
MKKMTLKQNIKKKFKLSSNIAFLEKNGIQIWVPATKKNQLLISSHNSIQVFDLNKRKFKKSLLGFVWLIRKLKIESSIASCSHRKIQIWCLKKYECIRILEGHTGMVRCLSQLETGNLISGSDDKTIKIWCIETGVCLRTFEINIDSIWSIVVLSSKEFAYIGSIENSIKILDIENGNIVRCFNGHTGMINCLIFSISSNEIITSSSDKTIKIWKQQEDNCNTLIGHKGGVFI